MRRLNAAVFTFVMALHLPNDVVSMSTVKLYIRVSSTCERNKSEITGAKSD